MAIPNLCYAIVHAAIVEKNPGRFRLNGSEVVQRRFFVQQTRDEIGSIKGKLQMMRGQDSDYSSRKVVQVTYSMRFSLTLLNSFDGIACVFAWQPLVEKSSPMRTAPKNTTAGYVRIPVQVSASVCFYLLTAFDIWLL